MGRVLGGITMSLDGFVTGPNDRLGAGLGDGGERLHYWVFGGPWRYGEEGGSATGADKEYIEETFAVRRRLARRADDARRRRRLGRRPGFGVPFTSSRTGRTRRS